MPVASKTSVASKTRNNKRAQPTAARRTDPPGEAEIRARAYQIFLARAGRPGDPESDWLQAERELRDGKPAAGPSRREMAFLSADTQEGKCDPVC